MILDMNKLDTFEVEIAAIEVDGGEIRILTLTSPDGNGLPGFQPGAHISVHVPPGDGREVEMWRAYSLIGTGKDTTKRQKTYRIGVLREADGRGGSRYMHDEIVAGDRLTIRMPPNGFALDCDDATPVLLAGGIGITPLVSMARSLKARGIPVQLHYTCRAPGQHILLDELFADLGADLYIYADQDPHRRFNIDRFLSALPSGQQIYVCGPEGLIEAVRGKARSLGWPDAAVHFELFSDAAVAEDAESFTVELAQSGREFNVPADRSLLDILTEAGAFVMQDCRQGHCGLCSVSVVSGEILHADTCLSDAQKEAGDAMQACVSRARGRLVLDL